MAASLELPMSASSDSSSPQVSLDDAFMGDFDYQKVSVEDFLRTVEEAFQNDAHSKPEIFRCQVQRVAAVTERLKLERSSLEQEIEALQKRRTEALQKRPGRFEERLLHSLKEHAALQASAARHKASDFAVAAAKASEEKSESVFN